MCSENKIKKLSIFTDHQFLIDSYTKWIPTWEANGRKTADGKPLVNRTELEELGQALQPLEVTWNHVLSCQDIEGDEAADQLARAGTTKHNTRVIEHPDGSTY